MLRVNHLAREYEFHRLALADQTREPLRPAAPGDDAEVDFGLAEACVLARDSQVARKSQLASAAEAEAVYHRDDGLRESVYGGEERASGHHVSLRYRGAPLEL